MKKRILAMLLSGALMIGSMPAALAEDIDLSADSQDVELTLPSEQTDSGPALSADDNAAAPAEDGQPAEEVLPTVQEGKPLEVDQSAIPDPDDLPEEGDGLMVEQTEGVMIIPAETGEELPVEQADEELPTEQTDGELPSDSEAAETVAASTISYTLRTWLSSSLYGDALRVGDVKLDTTYYICYALTETNTGRYLNAVLEERGISKDYTAVTAITTPNGTTRYTSYSGLDRDYWYVTTLRAGSYSATVDINGSLDITGNISWTVADSTIAATGISLNKSSVSVNKGSSTTLKATVSPSNATNKTVTWSSSNTSVATVSSSGVVKGVKGGSATITAKTSNGKTATCTVKVVAPVTGISLNKTSASVNKGSSLTLTATVSPSDASNKTITWSTSDKSVATVSSSGVVKGVKAGSATITAKTSNGKTAKCTVKVLIPATSVKLNKTSASVSKGSSTTLKATVSPSNASNKTVTWSSSNTSVATVSSSGVVKGVKAGSATITAKTHNGKTAKCTVKVTTPATGIKLNKTSARVSKGYTVTLKATVSPSTATNKTVTWSTSSKAVATVSSSGVVKGVKAGTATITAKTSNGKKATCKVTVGPAPTSVKLNKTTASVNKGSSLTLKATVSPSNAGNKTVTWSTSNKAVATVSSSGVVKGVKAGTATITAKTHNGKKATCKVTVKTPASSLTLSKLTYNFSNSYQGFGYSYGYYIPLSTYQIIYNDTMARYYYNRDGYWGGSCFGMATTSIMMTKKSASILPKHFKSGATKPSQLSPTNYNSNLGMNLRTFIEAMHVSQYDSEELQFEREHYNDLSALVSAVKGISSTGTGIQVSLYGPEGGHSVVGYQVKKISSTESRLYIYDPNFPNQERYIKLKTNSSGKYTGWSYMMNDMYEWSSSRSGSVISYIPYSKFIKPWNNRAKKKASAYNVLSINADDFDVVNEDGRVVAAMRDGELETNSKNIFEFRRKVLGDDDSSHLVYLPKDEYTVVNQDSSVEELEAAILNAEQSAEVVTTADEVTFTVDDAQECNTVSVDAKKGEGYVVALNSELDSAKGQEEVVFSGVSKGKEITVGMESGSCIATDKKAEVSINGMSVSAQTLS